MLFKSNENIPEQGLCLGEKSKFGRNNQNEVCNLSQD